MSKPKPCLVGENPTSGMAKLLGGIATRNGADLRQVFGSFARVSACAVSCGRREEEYLAELARYKADGTPQMFAEAFGELVAWMSAHPWRDGLGDLHQELSSKWTRDATGEFYTPTEVCRLVARCTIGQAPDLPRLRPMKLMEPACGSGRMILASAEYLAVDHNYTPDNLRVWAVDINPVACDVAFVNFALHGIPASVTCGNALDPSDVRANHTTPWWNNHKPEWALGDILTVRDQQAALLDEPETDLILVADEPKQAKKKQAAEQMSIDFAPALFDF